MSLNSSDFEKRENDAHDVVKMYFRANDVAIDPNGSEIIRFFGRKNVLVTGATGFLGKLLIEKLLRACEDIDKIYILVRPKKGVHVGIRIEEIFKDKVFQEMKKIRPHYKSKIYGIEGDLAQVNLGLQLEDLEKLTDEVDVIFHAAATTKFNEKLKLATAINVKGTEDILKIAKSCKNLKALVHVSTAYSHCTRNSVGEEFYDAPMQAEELMDLVDSLDDEHMQKMTPGLLGEWPNTYSFTKAIAEDLIRKDSNGVPTCIARPSIVVATAKEPQVAWMNNVFGPTYIVAGVMNGQVRVGYADSSKIADVVPGDYCINNIIAAAYNTAMERSSKIKIYNIVSYPENPVSWGEFIWKSVEYSRQVQPSTVAWHSTLYIIKSSFMFHLLSFLLHSMPALLVDLFLTFSPKKISLFNMYKKVMFFSKTNAFFSKGEWKFTNDNTQLLWKSLNDSDKKAFPFSMKDFNWDSYCVTYAAGIREFIFKESWDTLPDALKKRDRLYMVHRWTQALLIFLFLYLISKIYAMFY